MVNFASNVTLLRQTFTDKLTIEDTYMLNLCYEIIIDKTDWHFSKRPIYEILDSKYTFEEEIYQNMLREGKDDIIKNILSVYNSNLFKDIVVDLSGGKDGRTNYGALTNIKEAKKMFTIQSSKPEPKDLETAVGINNIFNFDYYTSGNIYYQNSILDYIEKKRRYFCGYHYLWYIETKHCYNLNKMRITGESFESLVVRYYSSTVKNLNLKDADEKELVEKFFYITI